MKMEDLMEIAKLLKKSSLLVKGNSETIENETKKSRMNADE